MLAAGADIDSIVNSLADAAALVLASGEGGRGRAASAVVELREANEMVCRAVRGRTEARPAADMKFDGWRCVA